MLEPDQLLQLRDEIQADPLGLGLAFPDQDVANADALNAVIVDNTVQRTQVAPGEMFRAFELADWEGMNAARRQYVQTLLTLGGGGLGGMIDASPGTNVRANLAAILQGSDTLTNILGELERDGSRAETLFGYGVTVTPGDVGRAENLIGQ